MRDTPVEKSRNAGGKTAMTPAEFAARELPLMSGVVTFCNNLPMSLYADTTVTKTPEVVFRGLVLSRTRFLSEEFLLNFRRSESDFGVAIGTNNYRLPVAVAAVVHRDLEENDEGLIALPPYDTLKVPLGPVIRSRRSVRRYSGKPLSLETVSTVLFYAAGISSSMPVTSVPGTASLGPTDRLELRNAASGGGLYPIDVFVIANKVEALEPGVYRYLPRPHGLRRAGLRESLPALGSLAQFGEVEVDKAGMLLVYVYNLFENSRKYGDAGLAYAFIEVGGMSAHVHLACAALGLGACDVGGFAKSRFERLIDADGLSRHMVHLTVIGK